MSSPDTNLINQIVQDTNHYLDNLQRQDLLWADMSNHIAASHLAESLGERALMSRHLQVATLLILEIHRFAPQVRPTRKKN